MVSNPPLAISVDQAQLNKDIEKITKELLGQDDSQVAKLLMQRAEKYIQLGRRDEASADIRTAVKTDGKNKEIVQNAESLIQRMYTDIKTVQPASEDQKVTKEDSPKLRLFKEIMQSVSDKNNTSSYIKELIVTRDFVDILQSCGDPSESNDVKTAAIIVLTTILNSQAMSEKIEGGITLLAKVSNVAVTCFKQCFDSGRAADKINAFATLTVLFQANISVGAEIFNQPGLLEDIMDTIDFEKSEVQIAFADALAQACSDSHCRKNISKYCSSWLAATASSKSQKDTNLQIFASIALTKLNNANDKATDSMGLDASATDSGVDQLANAMREHSISNEQLSNTFTAVIKNNHASGSQLLVATEGLAYNSMQAAVKDALVKDDDVLDQLFKIARENNRSGAILFGVATIFANITGYLPVLSEEQKQIKKLRNLANAKGAGKNDQKGTEDQEDPRDRDDAVNQRIEKLVDKGIVTALIGLSRSSSENIQAAISQTFLNIVTPPKTRGTIVQQGGAKCLLRIVGTQHEASFVKFASQALAKLAITMDPRIAFPGQSAHELVKPMLQLCQDDFSLRNFEALMALTNLASMDENIRARIYLDKGMPIIEGLQFSDNKMIRRAATELLCNMMFLGPVFESYSDPKQSGAQTKIKLLLALSDVDDFETRRAASGALAILANSPGACSMMIKENGYERISQLLLPEENVEVQHRGTELVRCLLEHNGKEAAASFVQYHAHMKLVDIVKNCKVQPVRAAAMDVLKLFSQNGITNFNA
ncbi:SWI5-dependent HO expression protein 4 [Umbelopsis sp. WA50703]